MPLYPPNDAVAEVSLYHVDSERTTQLALCQEHLDALYNTLDEGIYVAEVLPPDDEFVLCEVCPGEVISDA